MDDPRPGNPRLRPVLSCVAKRRAPLFNLMHAWFEAAQFGADSQRVIALRMMKLASGGPQATTEARRMVSEKIHAFGMAQTAVMSALMTGSSLEAAAVKAYVPYRRAVRANSRRLGS
jgi:hypothetical protein